MAGAGQAGNFLDRGLNICKNLVGHVRWRTGHQVIPYLKQVEPRCRREFIWRAFHRFPLAARGLCASS